MQVSLRLKLTFQRTGHTATSLLSNPTDMSPEILIPLVGFGSAVAGAAAKPLFDMAMNKATAKKVAVEATVLITDAYQELLDEMKHRLIDLERELIASKQKDKLNENTLSWFMSFVKRANNFKYGQLEEIDKTISDYTERLKNIEADDLRRRELDHNNN